MLIFVRQGASGMVRGPGKTTVRPQPVGDIAAPTTPDPIEIAMEAEASGIAPAGQASLLLADQRRLIGWQIASERAGVALKVGTGLLGLAAVLLLSWMAWSASRAEGLVIRPLSVPPALAQRGVTGEALAAQLMDRLGDIADSARSSEAQRQVSATQGDGVSIQIPETGISLSQLDQWLKERLGRERRVTGEVATVPDGTLVLTTRDGAVALPEQHGPEGDLPAMLQRAAEALMQLEQPVTYGAFLQRSGRNADLIAHARWMIAHGDRTLMAIGYTNLAVQADNLPEAKRLYRKAQAVDPLGSSVSYSNLAGLLRVEGRSQEAYGLFTKVEVLLRNPKAFPSLSAAGRRQRLDGSHQTLAFTRGDYATALAQSQGLAQQTLLGYLPGANADLDVAIAMGGLHDIPGARGVLAGVEPENADMVANLADNQIGVAFFAQDWPEVLRLASLRAPRPGDAGRFAYGTLIATDYANIRTGRLDAAEARIAPTPLTCMPCVILRGELAAARGQPVLADHWFAEASRMAPSLADAPFRWGGVLMTRGNAVGAARQFQEAARRSPRYADALAGWGEALLAQGDAKTATRKFAAANALAPKWGRLHLKWGEALAKLGKADEAQAQFRTAATLYLTPPERAELQRLNR